MPRSRLHASFLAIVLGTSTAACASIWGFEDGSLITDTGDATADASPDAMLVGDAPSGVDVRDARELTDGASDAKAPTDASSSADADADAAVDAGDPCTLTTADPNSAVFVAGSGNDGPNCGTPSNPCHTIQTGLDRANAGGVRVVDVQQGSYAESISLYPGITLVGGWETSWVKNTTPTANALVALQPTTQSSAVVATQLFATSRICTLTILGKAQAAPGESLYGVFATGPGASLLLDDTVIVVGAGGDGVPGDAGAPAADASSGACSAGDGGKATSAGDAGSPGAAGVFTVQGYEPGAGGLGSSGYAGSSGIEGGAPPCVTCYGGCSALCGATGPTTECGDPGTSGCGGAPGHPGGGGGGGGSSIGVFAWQTTVVVSNCHITVGNGGNGATGGQGGAGGAGGTGAAGAPGASCTVGCASCGLACCSSTSGQPGGGSPGGPGGSGSAGGNGGGGAGGSSCATAFGGNAGSVSTASTTMITGDAGKGAGGAADGISSMGCQ
ncbi:MAG TPA: hypothetical protein VMI75_04680 [Polyangiaceae bacterium]|nr:hypothetical protein [Polyangiaceae bacterium]